MKEHNAFGENNAAGAARRQCPPADRHRHLHPQRRLRRLRRHRRALRRDEGGARRLLPDRGRRPGRGHRRSQAGPRAVRWRRGAPDHGRSIDDSPRDRGLIRCRRGRGRAPSRVGLRARRDGARHARPRPRRGVRAGRLRAGPRHVGIARRARRTPAPGSRRSPAAAALDLLRRDATLRRSLPLLLDEQVDQGPAATLEPARGRGRQAAPDLHLLPPRPRARGAGRTDAAAAVRPDHRGGGARLPGERADDGGADHPGEEEDRGGPHSLPRAAGRRTARADPRRPHRRAPALHDRPHRARGRRPCPPRPGGALARPGQNAALLLPDGRATWPACSR